MPAPLGGRGGGGEGGGGVSLLGPVSSRREMAGPGLQAGKMDGQMKAKTASPSTKQADWR